MSLRPGVILPTDMDMREWSRWCQDQAAFVGTNDIGDEAITTAKLDDEAVTTAKIDDAAVTLAKLADMAADRILGRLTSSGVPTELTAAQVASLLETAIEALNLDLTGNIGFHGVAASGQQTTPSALSLTAVSGTGDDATINANFGAIQTAVNALKTILDNKGLAG